MTGGPAPDVTPSASASEAAIASLQGLIDGKQIDISDLRNERRKLYAQHRRLTRSAARRLIDTRRAAARTAAEHCRDQIKLVTGELTQLETEIRTLATQILNPSAAKPTG